MRDRPAPRQPRPSAYIPRAPVWRRGVATGIDAVLAWGLSSVLGPSLHWPVFLLLWLALRVVLVANNRGQSIGRLAMDVKLLDLRSRRIPTFLDLAKREAIVGTVVLLALIGLGLLAQINPAGILLIAPLGIDYATALADTERYAALHDRPVDSVVIQTQRGFSLDLKVRRWYQLLLDRSERFMRK